MEVLLMKHYEQVKEEAQMEICREVCRPYSFIGEISDIVKGANIVMDKLKKYVIDFPDKNETETGKIEKLKKYEDLEKRGRLIKLPCDIGDRVYEIYQFCGGGAWEIDEHRIRIEDLEKIEKTVFLSRKEAEAALEERKNKIRS